MRRFVILIPIILTILVFGIFTKVKVSLGQTRASIVRLLLDNDIFTAEDWGAWEEKNLRYIDDGAIDYWAKPYETIEKRGGDCEDFALLNKRVLILLGYEAKALGLTRNEDKGEGHAICIFFDGYYWRLFDNQYLVPYYKFKTKSEIIEWIKSFYRYQKVEELK